MKSDGGQLNKTRLWDYCLNVTIKRFRERNGAIETVSGRAESMFHIWEKSYNLINLINLVNFYLKAAKANLTSDLSGVPLRRSFWREMINYGNCEKRVRMEI